MTRLDALLLTLSLAVGLGGALYSMYSYTVYADSMARREVSRQKSLAVCDEARRGTLYRDEKGYVWCTLYSGEGK